VEVPVVVGGVAEGSEWELTTTAERGEDGALALGGELGFGAVEGADGLKDGGVMLVEVVGAGFEGEGALAGSGG